MPLLDTLSPSIDLDQVLRAQGANPAVVRARSPRLVEIAAQAMEIGLPLVAPRVHYRQLMVHKVEHERLRLAGGASLAGKTIIQLLAPAKQVVVLVCSIGPGLENLVSAVLPGDASLGLALDGLATAAVESLAEAACRYFGEQAAGLSWQATVPLSPGMEGWPAESGQRQIFAILPSEETGVSLNDSGMMLPQKSLSLVVGFGPEVDAGGRVCDYCSMRNSCRHQDTYA